MNLITKSDESDPERDYLSDDIEYENNVGIRYTTGNEADVEDNMPPPTPTPDALYEKLRMKPPQCTPTTPCRLASAREECNTKSESLKRLSTAERLSRRPKTALETITDTIERPEGSVPPLALPMWHSFPLDQKIPLVPAPKGLMYYTPGKLTSKLHREPKIYSVSDPNNRERVVGSPYTALHDPHTKEFISRPETRRLLHSQGLINEKDEIMYSLREFNKYRDYLRTLYSDDVHKNVHYADELFKNERDQARAINTYLSQTEGKGAEWRRRLNNSRRLKQQRREYVISRYMQKERQTESRLIQWAEERELINTERIVRSLDKQRLHQKKLKSVYKARRRAAAQACQQAVLKDIRCYEKKNLDSTVLKRAHEMFLLEWMDSKINQSETRMDMESRIDAFSRENLKIRAARRQHRVETYRRNIPVIIERRRLLEVRRWDIARKYFYLWLAKTRERQQANIDIMHESVWIKGTLGTLDDTVKYLRFQTNTHEKLDDFILNIVRLKENIARQLELEEAEEQENASAVTEAVAVD